MKLFSVYVGRLPTSIRASDLVYIFQNYFPRRIDLKNGYGFIEFEEPNAYAAVHDMNELLLHGRPVIVQFAKRTRQTNKNRPMLITTNQSYQNSNQPTSNQPISNQPTLNQTIVRPDELWFSVSVEHHNEGRATVSTSTITIHDQFLSALRQLIIEELATLTDNPNQYMCFCRRFLSYRDEDQVWDYFYRFIEISSSHKHGRFTKYVVGIHGDQLAIFSRSRKPIFSVCDNDACMIRFANDKNEIVQFKPDIDPFQSDFLWTIVQSNPNFKNCKVLNNSVWQLVYELVQKANQSDMMKQFRESVRKIIIKPSNI